MESLFNSNQKQDMNEEYNKELRGISISEARILKRELEDKIFDLLNEYEKETGCEVSKIDILKEGGKDNVTLNGHRIFIGVSVNVFIG